MAANFNYVCGIYMEQPRVLLTLGASLSICSYLCIFILYYYYKIPNLRRHPTTLTIHKCWFELLFVSQFLWISFAPPSFFWATVSDERSDCETNPNIWPLAWLTQFSLLGGELWLAVLSLDIHRSLTNPFTSYLTNAFHYRVVVYGLAMLTATILVSIVPMQYGLSVDPMIWINDYDSTETSRYTKFYLYYMFMIVIYVYSGGMVVWARSQIYKGLEETLAMRKYQISKQTRYVIGFFAFWTCVFTLQFVNYLSDTDNHDFTLTDDQNNSFRSSSAFLLASRGLWSCGIFLTANWTEIACFFEHPEEYYMNQNDKKNDPPAPVLVSARRGGSDATSNNNNDDGNLHRTPTYVTQDTTANTTHSSNGPKTTSSGRRATRPREAEQLQLNLALQTEIVRFTVLGIQKAIQEYAEIAAREEHADAVMLAARADELGGGQRDGSRSTSMNGLLVFQTKRPAGEEFTFMLSDPDSDISSNSNHIPRSSRDKQTSLAASTGRVEANELEQGIDTANMSSGRGGGSGDKKDDGPTNNTTTNNISTSNPLQVHRSEASSASASAIPAPTASNVPNAAAAHKSIPASPVASLSRNAALLLAVESQNNQNNPPSQQHSPMAADASFRSSIRSESRASFLQRNEKVSFAFEDHEMRRQTPSRSSGGTGSMPSFRMTHVSNNFIDHIGAKLKQRFRPPVAHSFMFSDYSAREFAKMRELSNISDATYLNSFKSTTMPSFSDGRSGAFLYFSSDRKYIVKTTTASEFDKLLQILPQYVDYFQSEFSQGRKPLINRFLGAHKIIMYDIPLYFVVMENICPHKAVQEKYDLKGSWINRHSSKKREFDPRSSRPKKFTHGGGSINDSSNGERTRSVGFNLPAKASSIPSSSATARMNRKTNYRRQDGAQLFLDNDLQNCFLLHPHVARRLSQQILRDIKLLESFNLMDYSLLVGVKRRNYAVVSGGKVMPIGSKNVDADKHTRSNDPSGKLEDQGNDDHDQEKTKQRRREDDEEEEEEGDDEDEEAIHAAVVEGQGTFYIGIIDILQEWNYQKWYERMFKMYVLGKDGKGLSAMDPLNYRRRFYQRAVLDVFDGLDTEDAQDEDIFERESIALTTLNIQTLNYSTARNEANSVHQSATSSGVGGGGVHSSLHGGGAGGGHRDASGLGAISPAVSGSGSFTIRDNNAMLDLEAGTITPNLPLSRSPSEILLSQQQQ